MKPKPWTKEQTEKFLAEAFANRIAWVAARTILVRVTNDETYNGLSEENRQRIERFLRDHPVELIDG